MTKKTLALTLDHASDAHATARYLNTLSHYVTMTPDPDKARDCFARNSGQASA